MVYRKSCEKNNLFQLWLDPNFHWAHWKDYELRAAASHQQPTKKAIMEDVLEDEACRRDFVERLFPNFELANYKLEDFEFIEYDKNDR